MSGAITLPPVSAVRDTINFQPPSYNRGINTTITLLVIAVITIYALCCAGYFVGTAAPINLQHLTIGLSCFSAILAGSAFIIFKTIHHPKNGKFWSDKHFQPVYLSHACHQRINTIGFIDTSAEVPLPKEEGLFHPIYDHKDMLSHVMIVINVMAGVVIEAAVAIIRHLATAVLTPIYVMATCLSKKIRHRPLPPNLLSQTAKRTAQSINRAVTAPFYMLAVQLSCLFACIDPLNGRKLGALIDKQWAHGKFLHESVWSAVCLSVLFTKTFFCDAWHKLKNDGSFFIAGCWQPIAYIQQQPGHVRRVIYYHYRSVEWDIKDRLKPRIQRDLGCAAYDPTK